MNYNNFSKTFSESRKNLKWEEINYFLSSFSFSEKSILDIGCGSGRLLKELLEFQKIDSRDFVEGKNNFNYLGIDSSSGMISEAKTSFPNHNFRVLEMQNIEKLEKKFDIIFFIASFHHLENFEERKSVLEKSKNLLNQNGKIFMTNWALESNLNKEKYKNSFRIGSENNFGSKDFEIKIGEFKRFYHSFSLEELEFLSKETGFQIVENRLFENDRNFITILEN